MTSKEPTLNSGSFSQALASGRGTAAANLNVPPLLVQYWHVVTRWRWLMLSILALCVVIGTVFTLLVPSKYTATVQVEINRQQKQITKVQGIEDAEAGMDLEFYATQYALLKARPVAERIASELKLAGSAEFYAAHGLDIPAAVGSGADAIRRRDQQRQKVVVNLLLDNIKVEPIRASRLVDLAYTSRSAPLSATIANKWAESFVAISMDRQFASTADARRFLEQRLTSLRQRLEDSERRAVLYASNSNIIALDAVRGAEGRTVSGRTLTGANLEQLASALNDARSARIAAESRSGTSGDSAAESATSPVLAGLRQQRSQVAADYARISVQFDQNYPPLQELAAQLKSIEATIERETSRLSTVRNREYQEALAREANLQQQVEQAKSEFGRQNTDSIQYNIFQREADTNRQLYDALLQRYKEIGIAGTIGINNISIVEQAVIPQSPSSPNLLLNLALSVVIGLGLATVTVFGLEQIDEGVRDPTQVEPLLHLPLLGFTPKTEGAFVDEMRDTKSHIFDAYFSIRSSLAFSTDHGFPRSLAVLSTRPAEGKTWTSSAIAVVLGRTDKRVLLVDGDLRSPSIHDNMGVTNDRGLSNYLAGDDAIAESIHATEFKNVFVMPAGPVPPSAAELLSGDRLVRFIAEALKEFDHVVIDSAPVLGMTDAPSVAQTVEGVVYVVESTGPAVRGVRASISRVQQVGAHIFGVVLTKVQQKQGGYGYGYGYGYGERYGSKTK